MLCQIILLNPRNSRTLVDHQSSRTHEEVGVAKETSHIYGRYVAFMVWLSGYNSLRPCQHDRHVEIIFPINQTIQNPPN